MIHYVSDSGKYRIAFEYDFARNALSGSKISGAPAGSAYATVASAAVPASSWYSGYDVFGQAPILNSRFSVFGIWQYIKPNTNIGNNPLDVQRVIGGIEYTVNKHIRFAATSHNLLHTNSSTLATAVSNAGGSASDVAAATQDINAVMLNMLFDY
jgi:hypothetical protein